MITLSLSIISIVVDGAMGITYVELIDTGEMFVCRECGCHLSRVDDVVNDAFHGNTGKAFLISNAKNLINGPEEKRRLVTGNHICADVYCVHCNYRVGWTYVSKSVFDHKTQLCIELALQFISVCTGFGNDVCTVTHQCIFFLTFCDYQRSHLNLSVFASQASVFALQSISVWSLRHSLYKCIA